MSTRTMPVAAILAAGVGMGFAGDLLLRGPGEPGLNFALLFAGTAASVGIVSFSGGPRLSREAGGWIAVGILFGTGLLWRGSGLLRFLAFVSASAAFANSIASFSAGCSSGLGETTVGKFPSGSRCDSGTLTLWKPHRSSA